MTTNIRFDDGATHMEVTGLEARIAEIIKSEKLEQRASANLKLPYQVHDQALIHDPNISGEPTPMFDYRNWIIFIPNSRDGEFVCSRAVSSF